VKELLRDASREVRSIMWEVTELDGVDENGGYRLRSIFQTAFDTNGGDLRPVFQSTPGYRPGPKLRRRLEVEGITWIS